MGVGCQEVEGVTLGSEAWVLGDQQSGPWGKGLGAGRARELAGLYPGDGQVVIWLNWTPEGLVVARGRGLPEQCGEGQCVSEPGGPKA